MGEASGTSRGQPRPLTTPAATAARVARCTEATARALALGDIACRRMALRLRGLGCWGHMGAQGARAGDEMDDHTTRGTRIIAGRSDGRLSAKPAMTAALG